MKITTIVYITLVVSVQTLFSQQELVIAGGPDTTLHAPNFNNFTPVFTGRVMDMETGTLRQSEYSLTLKKKVIDENHLVITWIAEGNLGGSNQVRQDVYLDKNPRIISLPESGDWELLDYADNVRSIDLEWDSKLSVDHYTSLMLVFKLNDLVIESWRDLPTTYSKGKTIIEVFAIDKQGNTSSETVTINVVRPYKRI